MNLFRIGKFKFVNLDHIVSIELHEVNETIEAIQFTTTRDHYATVCRERPYLDVIGPAILDGRFGNPDSMSSIIDALPD